MDGYFDSIADKWEQCPDKINRARATADKIHELAFDKAETIVDYGCGTGLLGLQLCSSFKHVTLVDASENMLKIVNRKLSDSEIKNADTQQCTHLAELKGKYSIIVTSMTLHHVADVNAFFEQAFQCLSTQGRLIVADLYLEDGSFHAHNPKFNGHNGFDPVALSKVAERIGFPDITIEPYYNIIQDKGDVKNATYPLFFFVAKKGRD
ncbi:class I SAM-dependent DNA methyltransferase [Thaumasiovibrio subtropicus]|uniref:class I SAM-dependent DNA methyltransferase n=1 Tax=Thaumasiovibrio subtropicus TaxID=1891207 RepID=UPI000B34B963|nr:class I SAM-dependent methyltransferase [Thaumasiovibrio subtropicus]